MLQMQNRWLPQLGRIVCSSPQWHANFHIQMAMRRGRFVVSFFLLFFHVFYLICKKYVHSLSNALVP